MQILKPDVKEKILISASKEFKNKGYKKSSIRQIARNAGMTEGNIYRYFKGKESILEEIVEDVYREMMELLKIHKKVHENYDESSKDDMYLIESLVEVYKKYRVEMIILIDRSQGTKFENVKDEIVVMIEESIDKKVFIEPYIAHAIAEGFVKGIISLFKKLGEEENFPTVIREYYNFYFRDIEKKFL